MSSAIETPPSPRLQWAIIAVALSWLLAGCSAVRLVYNQAPTFAFWWLDGYFDFDAEQAERAREALNDWFAWHRATQLPDYAALLAQAQQQAQHDFTADEVCRWSDAFRQRIETAYDHGVPALARMVTSLKPDQVRHVERRYRKSDEEFRDDFLQPSRAERLEASTKRTVSRAELVYGRLDDAQRALLAQGLAASPFDAQRWLAERQLRQREIVESLRALQARRADVARAEGALRLLAAHAVVSPRPAYREYQRRLLEHNCQLIARLHNSTTPAQRRHAAERLKGWEEDLRVLANQRPVEVERGGERPDRP